MNFEELKNLLERDRSIRRFKEDEPVSKEILKNIVELTRYCASGRNLQPFKYKLINEAIECAKIFPLLNWAGYLSDWPGPEEGERPSAYLIQCLDTNLIKNPLCDDGLQIQAITLGITSLDLGACIIKSFNKEELKNRFKIPEHLDPYYIIALGFPVEKVVIENMSIDGDIKYYRTHDRVHHVPKRSVDDLIF